MIILTVINVLIFFSNAILVGHIGKLTNAIDEKLEDFAMLETRLKHYFEDADTALR